MKIGNNNRINSSNIVEGNMEFKPTKNESKIVWKIIIPIVVGIVSTIIATVIIVAFNLT